MKIMTNDYALLYAVRRNSDFFYFKKTKSAYLKSWKKDDPRRQNWTPEASSVTLYALNGAVVLLGKYRNSAKRKHAALVKEYNEKAGKDNPDPIEEYEIVRFICTEQEVVDV